jgi:hypothetical protein
MGWGFDDLLPFFQCTERAEGRDPAVRGAQGPMVVAPAAKRHPAAAAYLEAAAQTGHARASDVSSGLEEGFGWVDLNIVDGRRQSAADGELRVQILTTGAETSGRHDLLDAFALPDIATPLQHLHTRYEERLWSWRASSRCGPARTRSSSGRVTITPSHSTPRTRSRPVRTVGAAW